jgi:hypothetical protein
MERQFRGLPNEERVRSFWLGNEDRQFDLNTVLEAWHLLYQF